jgi:hypothetical protein
MVSVLPASTGPTQQRLANHSRKSASHGSAYAGTGLERISLSFRRRAESPALGKLGQRRRENTENTFIAQRSLTVKEALIYPCRPRWRAAHSAAMMPP